MHVLQSLSPDIMELVLNVKPTASATPRHNSLNLKDLFLKNGKGLPVFESEVTQNLTK